MPAANLWKTIIITVALSINAYAQTIESTLTGKWNLPFSEDTRAIVVKNNTAYSASVYEGLVIYDVTDPRHPQKLGSLPSTYAQDVSISGNYAYLADYDSGLRIIDVTDPTTPTLVGSFQTSYDAYGVEVSGSYAYMAIESGGLEIIDVTNAAAPVLVGSYGTDEYMYDLVVRDNYAFIGEYSNGLLILDISNPASPQFVASLDTDDYTYDVKVQGDYAYLADQGGGLKIVDISTITAPVMVASYPTSDDAMGVYIDGDIAYLSVYYDGLLIFDITDKTAPILLSETELPNNGSGYDVFVSNGFAYVADDGSTAVVDVSNPSAPVLEDGYKPVGNIKDVFAVGNLLYIACDQSGLQIADATDPAKLSYLGGYVVEGETLAVFVADNIAYLSVEESGLYIFDVSNPSHPTLMGHLEARYRVQDVYVRPPYAYVADQGLRIVDISDPSLPEEVGYRVTSRASGVWVSGNTAYVADYDYGVRIIDVQNPYQPTLLSTYQAGKSTTRLEARENRLYVAYPSLGLEIIDVTDSVNPVRLGGFDTEGYAYDLHLSGNTAMIADSQYGLQVLDISDPTTPVHLSNYDTEDSSIAIAVSNGHAYLAEYDKGIKIVRVGSTDAPAIACTPNRIVISADVGMAPTNGSFGITNTGTGSLNYDILSDVDWVTFNPDTGTSTGETDTISLNYSTSGLAPGYHMATVSITAAGAPNSPFAIPIELWVEPLPLSVATTTLPSGMEMVPYSEMLQGSDGIAPYEWKDVSGWPGGLGNAIDGNVSGKPILNGNYVIETEITDARGKTATGSVEIYIELNPNRPPAISWAIPDDRDFLMGEQLDQLFKVVAIDPESVPLSYSWFLDGTPVGGDSSEFTFQTAWGDAGIYELEVFLYDDLWDSVSVLWTIEVTNDNDSDGIPNDFENAHPMLDAWVTEDGATDPDGDRLDNYGEYLAGTLLDDPDCDDDSLPDGWEVRNGFDPLDPSGGLTGILCTRVGTWESPTQYPGHIESIMAEPGHIYAGIIATTQNKGFYVFDTSSPTVPTLAGTRYVTEDGFYRDIVRKGNYVYMGLDRQGINIFDVSNPAAPNRVSVVAGRPSGLAIEGNYLYTTDQYTGFRIYSLTSPTAPAELSVLAEGTSWDVAIQGTYAYLAHGYNGLKIIDISNPSSPSVVSNLALPSNGTAYAIALKGSYAYIADGQAGVQVIDISDPLNPLWVARYNTTGNSWKIQIVGDYAYVASYENYEMQIIDISVPSIPLQVGSYNADVYVYGAQAVGNLVYVGTGKGLHVVETVSEDVDMDGMLDAWEMDNFSTLAQGATDDFDNDGVWDLGEFRTGFDPTVKDTDNDGISDGDEVTCGTSPLDVNDILGVNEVTFTELDSVVLIWASVPGFVYEVQYSSSLISVSWTTLTTVTATSVTSSYTDNSSPDLSGCFYRIVALP